MNEKQNKGKCLYKKLDIECAERKECDGYVKVDCPLSNICNIRP